jgi:hypothetical protein
MKRNLTPHSEETAKRMAEILGPSCASAQALKELEERRKNGEQVDLFVDDDNWLVVGPTPGA